MKKFMMVMVVVVLLGLFSNQNFATEYTQGSCSDSAQPGVKSGQGGINWVGGSVFVGLFVFGAIFFTLGFSGYGVSVEITNEEYARTIISAGVVCCLAGLILLLAQ